MKKRAEKIGPSGAAAEAQSFLYRDLLLVGR
jgi:hypothetical protein